MGIRNLRIACPTGMRKHLVSHGLPCRYVGGGRGKFVEYPVVEQPGAHSNEYRR